MSTNCLSSNVSFKSYFLLFLSRSSVHHMGVVVVQSSSRTCLSVIPWFAVCRASLPLTISQSLPKFVAILSVIQSSYLILWHPLPIMPSIFLSIRDFSNELDVCIRWTKIWNFSFSISPSNEHSGLISFKIEWFDLFDDQGTLGFFSNLQWKWWIDSRDYV